MLVGSWLAFDKTISILAGNLNSGGSYLITAVPKKRKLLPCVNHRIVLCNLFFDHTNYISLGNYCFIVFMGKIIWFFSTKFQNRRVFYFTSLELFAKLTMPYLLAEQIRANGKGFLFFRIKTAEH